MNNRLGIKQTEEKTGYNRQTIWRKCKDGTFPVPHYIGNRRFWYEEEIDNWLKSNIRTTPTHINLPSKNIPSKKDD
ncbi:MAG: hypothetical protein RIR39_1672 [Pseudomonadota bacterium]|jgi:predicted DNA-binding transcriptional regulator AlpA